MQRVFESWGVFAARRPWVVLAMALALVLLGWAGMTRIVVSTGAQQVFASGSEAYTRYEAMRALFPPSEKDAVLVVSDPDLLTAERLEALRNLHLDLSLQEGVTSVVSLFSARRAQAGEDSYPPLVPAAIPRGAAFEVLAGEIVAHPLIRNRLISDDGSTALFSIALDPDLADLDVQTRIISELRDAAAAELAPYGLAPILTGTPVIEVESYFLAKRERLWLNLLGFVIGTMISYLYFRRLTFAALAVTVPAAAIVITFGTLGWLGIPLSLTLQIVAPLVIVIAFNNAMHMLFAIVHCDERQGQAGSPVSCAIGKVGPASLMTSLTSAIAFSALMLADSNEVRAFGALAAFGTVAAFFAVITIIPALAAIAARLHHRFMPAGPRSGGDALASVCTAIDRRAARRPGTIVVVGVILVALFAYAQQTLVPNYQLVENVPTDSETRSALDTIDTAFGGSQPLQILARWTPADPAAEAVVLDQLETLGARLAAHPSVGSVASLATLSTWLADTDPEACRDINTLVDALPEDISARLIDRDAGAALITAMVPDQTTSANSRLIADIAEILADTAQAAPDISFEITGIVALTALEMNRIINALQVSLITAIVMIIALIGLTFRRLWPAAISILPNIFPILAGGAFLAARDGQLGFAGAIAMTVAFGLAVDDTIHVLYRFRHEQADGWSVERALERTVGKIGEVLVLSTLVLIAGISVLFLSPLPMNRDFAQLTEIILVAALVGDLVFLPALIRVFRTRLPQASVLATALPQEG